MEDISTPHSELWESLQEEAIAGNNDDFREALFPVKFEDRKPEEKLRTLALNGLIPLTAYGFYLALWGINLSREVPLVSYLMLFLVPILLAWLVAPAFRFTSLKRVGDIPSLFCLGLLLPLIFACVQSAVSPDAWRLTFATQATNAFFYYSAATTILPFFGMSVGIAWFLKYFTRRELTKSPWWDEPKPSPGRMLGAWGLLLLPFGVYGLLLSSSLPSQEVNDFLAESTTTDSKHRLWLRTFSDENEEAWRSLAKTTLGLDSWNFTHQSDSELQAYGEGALRLLQEGRLPPRGSYDLLYNHYDYLQISHRTKHDVEILTLSFAEGLVAGRFPKSTPSYRMLEERLKHDVFSVDQLLELKDRLQALKVSLPTADIIMEEALRTSSREYTNNSYGIGLLGWLNKRGLGPEALANKAWLNDGIETWLEFEDAVAPGALEDILHDKTAAARFAPMLTELEDSTRGLLRRPDIDRNLPELTLKYEEALELLIAGTDARLSEARKP